MTKLLPNELPVKIPGVEIVMNLPVYEQDVVVKTETIPAKTTYGRTADKTFQAGKTYYTESGNEDEGLVYTEAEVTEGDPIPPNTYFEKSEEAEVTAKTTTIYERLTTGEWVDFIDGQPVKREHAQEILRTVSYTTGDNDNGRTSVVRTHALGLWGNRASLNYVPISERLEADKLGESRHIFR